MFFQDPESRSGEPNILILHPTMTFESLTESCITLTIERKKGEHCVIKNNPGETNYRREYLALLFRALSCCACATKIVSFT